MINKHKKLWTIIFIVLNIAIVAYIAFSEFNGEFSTDDVPSFSNNWPLYIICAFLCLALVLFAETSKYVYMMHILGEKVSWRVAFETAALGKYYDCITPSGVGGQPFQIYWLHKRGYDNGPASSMPIMAFITMQSGFIILALIVFINWSSVELEAIRYTAYIGLICYALVPFALLVFSIKPGIIEKIVIALTHFGARLHIVKNPEDAINKIMKQFEYFNSSFKYVCKRKRNVIILLILSLIYQIALCSVAYFVLMALGGSEDYLHILATIVYIYATVTIVVTPGNSGAAEGVFYIVFSSIGTSGVFWAMIIWRLLTYYAFIAIGGIIFGFIAISAWIKAKKGSDGPNDKISSVY